MNKIFDRICMILAAIEVSDRELYDFSETICKIGPDAFTRYVGHKRSILPIASGMEFQSTSHNRQISRSTSSSTQQKIERLLIEEARLPKNMAIRLLTDEIEKRHPGSIFPSESRKGFSIWLEKLCAIISESELLHIATKIRNHYVHENPSDWRLK